jgi:hypothetical protein
MRPAYVLSILHNIQHHFMALSILNASLPALEDLITLTSRRSPSTKVGPRLTRDIRRDILLLRELNDYEDEVEYAYECIAELVREMPARCKSRD